MWKNVSFINRSGEKIAGVLHEPDRGPPRAYALFAHCFTCTKNIKAAVNISGALAEEGIAVLRFDFTGLGESSGEFEETHFSSNVSDLVDAAKWLDEHHEAPQLLVGHSLGGTAVLAAAHEIGSAAAVATIGSPADADHILNLLESDLDAIEASGKAQVNLAGRPFTIRKEFVDNIRGQAVRDGISTLRRALLVMHSPLDEIVNIDEAASIFTAARHPKSFVSLDHADHLLSREEDSRYAGQLLANWAGKYLAPKAGFDYPARKKNTVIVHSETGAGFFSTVNADGHHLLADEPISYGGTDRGPTPYEFLSIALGSCTAMTLNMYARHKNLPVESVTVETRHNKIHAQDCVDCKTKAGKVDQFDRSIKIEGDLLPEQRERMLEIADRCPVHRTLHKEVKIVSRLAGS